MSTTLTVVRDPKTGRFQRSEDAQAKALEDQALKKALGAVAKAFLTGNAAVMQPASTGGPQKPGTSWSNQGGTSSALIARVTQNLAQSFGRAPEDLELALAEQGLSWGPPFPPGRPLDPFWGYRRPPRMWDFAVGENVQLTPRWDRTSFQTIKAVYDAYDVAQIVVRHLINDVRSLKYSFVAPEGVTEDVSADIEQVREFFKMPDKRQPFRQWLAEWLQDVLRYDAGSLYIRRNEAGEPIALEVVDGTTLIPLIDFYGRVAADEDDNDATPGDDLFPANVTPAFLQIIEGLPWVWLTSDDILYQPWNPLPNSQYGLSPLESVLISANTDLRFQWHFLQYFTEGSLPAGFMEAPPDQSDPDSLAEWQETWDAIMLGDQAQLRQIRFVPSGSKFTPAKNSDFDDKFPLYLMRRVCAAYGVTPNDLGFTENVNRATGDTQVDVQFRVGIVPLLRYVEDVINLFIAQHLNLRACISIDDGREVEDRLVTAQANQIYINTGVKSGDEVRAELGLPIDKARPMPRYIMSPKGGTAQPVITLDAAAGKVDPETYGPDPSQKEPPKPPEPPTPPGMIAQGSPPNEPDGSPVEPPGNPGPDDEDAVKSAYQVIDALLDRLGVSKDGSGPGVTGGTMSTGGPLDIGAPDNTGGPGVTRGFSNASTITGGISVDTDIQGVDLLGPKVKEDDDEDDEDAAKALLIRQWRENAKNRLRKGLRPRRFDDAPSELQDAIWAKLESASSMEEVDRAFKETTPNPKGRPGPWGHLEQELTDYWEGPIALAVAAGIVPLAVATAWLHQREALAGMSQTPEAFAEALSLNDEPLKRTLTDLYSDSWLPGAKDAVSQVAHKPDLAGTQAVDAVDWPKWTPGDVPSQESLQGTGFESMLAQVDTWLSEIDATTKRQIAQALQDGIDEGLGAKQVGQKIDAVLHDPKRAQVIARTEVNRCMSQASIETYRQHGIAQFDIVTAWDPCPLCIANKDSGPHPITDVAAIPPSHVNCRCVPVPALHPSQDEADQPTAPGAQTISEAVSNVPLGFVGDVDQTSTRNAVGQSVSQTTGGA